MFFSIKEIKGKKYLYRLEAFRDPKTNIPTNSGEYIGPVKKIESAITRWRRIHGRN